MNNFLKATPTEYKVLGFLASVGFVISLATELWYVSVGLLLLAGVSYWQVDEKEELFSEYKKSLRANDGPAKVNKIEEKIMSNFSQKVPTKHELKAMRKRDEKGRYISN